MLVMMLRTIVLYLVVLLVVRIMGKRELGQLQPFEFVVAILIADLVSVPMSNTGVPIFYGIIPVLTLLVAHLTISQLSLKSTKFRNLICGKAEIVISNGIVDELMLRNLRYNLDDLFEQLRANDVFSIEDVEYAILETSGRLSLLLKANKQPPLVEDFDIKSKEDVWVPRHIIMDGEINKVELNLSGLTKDILNQKIINMGYSGISDIFICTVNKDERLYIQPKRKMKPT